MARAVLHKKFRRTSWISFFASVGIALLGTVIVVVLGSDQTKYAYFTPAGVLFNYGFLYIPAIVLYGFGVALPAAQLWGANRLSTEKAMRKHLAGRSLAWSTTLFWVVIAAYCLFANAVQVVDRYPYLQWNGVSVVLLLSVVWFIGWNAQLILHARRMRLRYFRMAMLICFGNILILCSGFLSYFMVVLMSMAD